MSIGAAQRLAIAFPTPLPHRLEGGLVVDGQHRLVLAELPDWPTLDGSGPEAGGAATAGGWAVERRWIGGLAVVGGDAWFTAADGTAVLARHCAGAASPLDAGLLSDGAGLAAAGRHLLVADRGHGRVHEIDVATGQPTWRWAGLAEPEDVAPDPAGGAWAATAAGIFRLHRDGPVAMVWSADDLGGHRPHSLAVVTAATGGGAGGGGGAVLVASVGLDAPRVVCFPLGDGPGGRAATRAVDLAATVEGAVAGVVAGLGPGPLVVRAGVGRLYVGAVRHGRVAVIGLDPVSVLGTVEGRPFTALAVDPVCDRFWATDGRSAEPSPGDSPVAWGRLTVGPLPLGLDPGRPHWLRLRAVGSLGPASLVLRARFDRPAGGPGGDEAPALVAAHDKQLPVPAGATGVTVEATLRRDGGGDPAVVAPWVESVELRVDEPGLAELLPAIYRSEGDAASFLDPFLRLAHTAHDDLVDRLERLPDQLDPATAVDDMEGDRWLDWLATWVDARLDERWTGARRRQAVAGAFERHALRGTARGLLAALDEELGPGAATIVEPGELASVWVLGQDGELGLTTTTVAAPPDGSLVEVTAALDRSHLTGPAGYGAPLFGGTADVVNVVVHQARVASPEARAGLEAAVASDAPLHTRVHLCLIEPGICLGLGGRIGIDTVLSDGGDPRAVSGLEGFRTVSSPPPSIGLTGSMVLR